MKLTKLHKWSIDITVQLHSCDKIIDKGVTTIKGACHEPAV